MSLEANRPTCREGQRREAFEGLVGDHSRRSNCAVALGDCSVKYRPLQGLLLLRYTGCHRPRMYSDP